MAAERTRAHIQREETDKSTLKSFILTKCNEFTPEQYLEDERKRLAIIEELGEL